MTNLSDSLRRFAEPHDLKVARGLAHLAFDRIWKQGWMSRTKAYHWLADQMGLPPCQAHIVSFDEQQCKTVICLANRFIDEVNR
jgi:hypothetical protein